MHRFTSHLGSRTRTAVLVAAFLVAAGTTVLLAVRGLAAQTIAIPVPGGQLTVVAPSFVVQKIVHRGKDDFAVVRVSFDLINETDHEVKGTTVTVDLHDPTGAVLGLVGREHSLKFQVPRLKKGKRQALKLDRVLPVAKGTQKETLTVSTYTFAVGDGVPPELDTEGPQRGHPSFSLLPFESIDVASGSLTLSFTDLELPGNGLLGLSVRRALTNRQFL